MRTHTVLALLVGALLSSMAHAQTRSEVFTYQGRLSDNGQPFSGTVDMQFAFYDQPQGGTLIGTDTATGVEVADGLFTAEFLLPAPVAIAPTWLEIRVVPAVGAPTLLSPRQRLRPAPLAANATGAEKLADGTVVFQRQTGLSTAESLSGTDDKSAFSATQTFVATRSGRPTLAFVSAAGSTVGTATIYDGPTTSGAPLASASISGFEFTFATFETTNELIAGQTYTLEVIYPTSAQWFTSDANPYADGRSSFGAANDLIFEVQVESPDVAIASVDRFGEGTFRRLEVTGTGSGDNQVQLPDRSISSAEILDEPGVAADFGFGGVIPTTNTALVEQSITVPGPGFVLATFTGEVTMAHLTGTSTSVIFGVSNTPGSIVPGNNDMQLVLAPPLPTGAYEQSAAAQGLFPVSSASTQTYYVVMRSFGGGTSTFEDYGFTLLYVPTSYGATSRGASQDDPEVSID